MATQQFIPDIAASCFVPASGLALELPMLLGVLSQLPSWIIATMLDWDNLRFLIAVAEKGSVIAGAKGLGVDKATISRRISALEHSLGARLFDRKASGWSLTAVGRKVMTSAKKVEAAVSVMLTDLGGPTTNTRTPVRLSAPQWFCSEVLLPRIGRLSEMANWIDLNLSARSRVADLAEREAEIGLRNVRPPKGSFVVRKVGELGSAIYASREYLNRRPPILTRADVLQEKLIAYPDRLTYVPGLDWLNTTKSTPLLRVDDAFAITAAIRASAGLGVIPCFLGDRDPVLQRVTDEHHAETIWLVAPIELARTLAVKRVFDFVAEAFAANRAALRGDISQRPPDTSNVVPVT